MRAWGASVGGSCSHFRIGLVPPSAKSPKYNFSPLTHSFYNPVRLSYLLPPSPATFLSWLGWLPVAPIKVETWVEYFDLDSFNLPAARSSGILTGGAWSEGRRGISFPDSGFEMELGTSLNILGRNFFLGILGTVELLSLCPSPFSCSAINALLLFTLELFSVGSDFQDSLGNDDRKIILLSLSLRWLTGIKQWLEAPNSSDFS